MKFKSDLLILEPSMFQGLKSSMNFFREEDFSKSVSIAVEYLWKQYLFVPMLPYGVHKVKTVRPTLDLKSLLDFTYSFCYGLLAPYQVRSELLRLIERAAEMKPRYILEIGTACGGTLFLLSRVAADDAVIISIDLPQGKWGGGYSLARIPLYQAFQRQQQRLHLLRQDSHAQATLETVRGLLQGQPLDFVFIDGDHTYEGVKKDFEMYSSLVRPQGIIALHDILHSKYKDCQVDRFWREIATRSNSMQFVENPDQQWAGIGLIQR